MKHWSLLPLLSAGLLALSGAACSSAPPAAPPPAASPTPQAEAAPRTIDLLCHEGARFAMYDKLGVPSGEYPRDVALTSGSAWVLFPERLVQITRSGERVDVRMHLSPREERWSKIDADPTDGSVWVIAETSLNLYRVSPEGKVSTVKLQRKVEGMGAFSGLVVGRDALYAQPACADHAVWRLDREGKLLGMAFELPAQPEPHVEDVEEVQQPGAPGPRCAVVRLERDADGRILAWERRERATWQVDDQGTWNRSDSPLFKHLGEPSRTFSLKGVDIGEKSEQWYFAGGFGDLFFWKGKPVFLGSWTSKERALGHDTVLMLPGDPNPQEALMTCHGSAVYDVATDATGYAAITDRFVVFGEFAGAPDLP